MRPAEAEPGAVAGGVHTLVPPVHRLPAVPACRQVVIQHSTAGGSAVGGAQRRGSSARRARKGMVEGIPVRQAHACACNRAV